jgi:hypothetical protein
MLADAQRMLGLAIGARDPAERYAQAHLAALRGAAAVLAVRALPRRSMRGSAWDLLARRAPELGEWAVFFAAGARRRQAIAAGVRMVVAERTADDMVRAAAEFLELVDGALGGRVGR